MEGGLESNVTSDEDAILKGNHENAAPALLDGLVTSLPCHDQFS
jgi:hypothetical protein